MSNLKEALTPPTKPQSTKLGDTTFHVHLAPTDGANAGIDKLVAALAEQQAANHAVLAQLAQQMAQQSERMSTLMELLGRQPNAPAPAPKARKYDVHFAGEDGPRSLQIVAR